MGEFVISGVGVFCLASSMAFGIDEFEEGCQILSHEMRKVDVVKTTEE